MIPERKHKRIVTQIKYLPLEDIKKIFKDVLETLPEKDRKKVFLDLIGTAISQAKYARIKTWMANKLKKDMSIRPLVLAKMYVYYSGMDIRMKPLLIKIARNVKESIRKKQKRSEF